MNPDDPLLDSLRSGGTRDDDGTFTIDAVRARVKLERFQLADPSLWAVLLVTAAVAGGARAIEFGGGRQAITVHFDGHAVDVARIGEVLTTLVGGSARDHDMAAALHALVGKRPRGIVLETQQYRLTLDAVGQRLEPVRDPSVDRGTTLRVSGLDLGDAERNAIDRLCAFAPLLITFDGSGIDAPFVIDRALVVRTIGGPSAAVLSHFHVRAPGVAFSQQGDGPHRAILAYVPKPQGEYHSAAPLESGARIWDGHARTCFVLHGQSFEVRHGQPPNSLFIVDADGLQKDLSQATLLDEPAVLQRLAWLGREFERMALALADALIEAGDKTPRGASDLLEAAARRLGVRPDLSSEAPADSRPHVSPEAPADSHPHVSSEAPADSRPDARLDARCKLLRCVADLAVWQAARGEQASVLEAIDEAVKAASSASPDERTRAQRHLIAIVESWQRLLFRRFDVLPVRLLRHLLAQSRGWLVTIDPSGRALGASEEIAALIDHLADDDARALEATGRAYSAQGASPQRLARVVDQTALLYRAAGDVERALPLHERARGLDAGTRSAVIETDVAFAAGRIDQVLEIGRRALASAAHPDAACAALLDNVVDALRLTRDDASALACCEQALALWSAARPVDLEQVERRELLAELIGAARRGGGRARPRFTRVLSTWLELRHARWTLRAQDDFHRVSLADSGRLLEGQEAAALQLRIAEMLAGSLKSTAAERGIRACGEALGLLAEDGYPHLSLRIGALWLAVRLHRFSGRHGEADPFAARLHLASLLADHVSGEC